MLPSNLLCRSRGSVQLDHQPVGLGHHEHQPRHPLAAKARGCAERALLQGAVQPAGQGGCAAASTNTTHGRWQPDHGHGE